MDESNSRWRTCDTCDQIDTPSPQSPCKSCEYGVFPNWEPNLDLYDFLYAEFYHDGVIH